MFLSESYKARLQELSGIISLDMNDIIEEAANLYKNSNKSLQFETFFTNFVPKQRFLYEKRHRN